VHKVIIYILHCVDLNISISALRLVNLTVAKLQNLTQRLQKELDSLTMMLQTLTASCHNVGLGSNCQVIPTQSYSVIDYTVVRNVLYKFVCSI